MSKEAMNCTGSELSIYLRGVAVGYSQTCCSGTNQLEPSRSSPIASKSYWQGKRTVPSHGSRFSRTCEPSTEGGSGDSPTLSPAGSPSLVKTSAPQVKVKDLPASVQAFGLRCCALLEMCGLALSSRKTVRIYAPVVLAPSYKDLPAWGMTADGACWELGTRARLTGETGCGLSLPTPTRAMARHGWGIGTRQFGQHGKKTIKDALDLSLGHWMPLVETVEWIQGWPIGWTDLKPLAMRKFRQWRRLHGGC